MDMRRQDMATNNSKLASYQAFSDVIAKRRATPSFDGSKIDDSDLQKIIQAGMEAPSGYNLQPWRFIVVRDLEQRRLLRQAAMGQPKVEDASAVIVFCGDLNAPRGESLEAVQKESLKHGFQESQNKQMKEMLEKTFDAPAGNAMGLAPDYGVWVNRHVMISFTTMLWMAEFLGYDTAPMEGFYEDKIKSLLKIPDSVRVVALLAIGRLKGSDKPYGGRRKMEDICFAEAWGKSIHL